MRKAIVGVINHLTNNGKLGKQMESWLSENDLLTDETDVHLLSPSVGDDWKSFCHLIREHIRKADAEFTGIVVKKADLPADVHQEMRSISKSLGIHFFEIE